MATKAKVLADSISPEDIRLITLLVEFPRIVLAEFNTHRVFSRNFASTRAIPPAVQIRTILTDPFIPEKFGLNQPGMQASRYLEGAEHDLAVAMWLRGRDRAVTTVLELILGPYIMANVFGYDPSKEYVPGDALVARYDEISSVLPKSTDDIVPAERGILNVHKQQSVRNLETFMFVEGIVTATEFDNFLALRDHPAAQPEIAALARSMRTAMGESEPKLLQPGEWHLPLVDEGEFDNIEHAIQSSVARCAAVSYRRQHNKNPERERQRYQDLLNSRHMSPFEHQGTPIPASEWRVRHRMGDVATDAGYETEYEILVADQMIESTEFCGPLRGWRSHRKYIRAEHNFGLVRKD